MKKIIEKKKTLIDTISDILYECNGHSGGANQVYKAVLKEVKPVIATAKNYKAELKAQNEINVKLGKALDSSQEEVKRLKEEKEAQFNQFREKAQDQTKKILELEGRVKELTELVKAQSDLIENQSKIIRELE
jgi:hypothetical protein